MDEVQIAEVARQGEKFKELEHRKEYILQTIEEQGKLTDDLRARISSCWDATVLEDIYLPYKPKRKTRAEVARKRGLEPLADAILHRPNGDPEQYARKFLSKEVASIEDALQGARDILAEKMNEDERVRNTLRQSFERTAIISSRVVKSKMEEAMNYRTYFDFSEPLHRCTSIVCLPYGAARARVSCVWTSVRATMRLAWSASCVVTPHGASVASRL